MERGEIAGALTALIAGAGWVYSWDMSEDIPQTFIMTTKDQDTVYVTLNWPEDFQAEADQAFADERQDDTATPAPVVDEHVIAEVAQQ